MIFQRDYILRMIQQLGEFVRRLKETLDEMEKARLLKDVCREKCGISLETADRLDTDSLARMLPSEPRLMLSELYYIRAMHIQAMPEDEAEWLGRSLRLLLSLEDESLICQERRERLHELTLKVSLTPGEELAAFRFFLEGEAFDWAEDALFFALEGGCPEAQAQGLAGFEGIRALSDERLSRGGLPREELEALIQELQARI